MDTKECETWQIRRVGPAASCRKVLNVMKLKLGVNSFGRSPGNDFFLDSKILKNFISRQHAEIIGEKKENGEEFLLREKGLNGTFINDVRIKGSSILKEGDKITFGHTNGYKIEPGQHSQQPHSEFQFVFEKCPRHNGELPNKRGLDSVEYHQTRTCCGNRKLPASPDYDRSECCDNLDKQGALKSSQSPDNPEPRVPLHTPHQSWNGKENGFDDSESGLLKKDSTVSYPSQTHIDDKKSTDLPDVPDFMQEVEIIEGTDSPENEAQESPTEVQESPTEAQECPAEAQECPAEAQECPAEPQERPVEDQESPADIIEVKHPHHCTPSIMSCSVVIENHTSHTSLTISRSRSTSEDEMADDDSRQRHTSGEENSVNFRDSEDSVSSSRTDSEIKTNGLSNGSVESLVKNDKVPGPKLHSRPNSAKSSSSYDECDGDVNGSRNIWNIISDSNESFQKDSSTSSPTVGFESINAAVIPVSEEQDESRDTPPSIKNHVIGRSIFPNNAQENDESLKRNHDTETNSMFSEDSDSKSSDTKSTTQSSTAPHKKRKKKRFATRTKRSKVTSKDDEKLEDGVEWYEVETCAAFDCTKPSDRRVQWVQCDDCDQWFHTVCAGCRYDDVKDSQMEFHCGCV